MKRQIIITASFFGALAVICGAFGAHALRGKLSENDLAVWHTAVQYQFYHVFALLFLTTLAPEKVKQLRLCYYLFTIGIVFFSGSLYLLSCADLLGWSWLVVMGPITPIGGFLFIAGWLVLGITAFRNKLS